MTLNKVMHFLIFTFIVFPIILPVMIVGFVWMCIKDGWRISKIAYQEFKDAA